MTKAKGRSRQTAGLKDLSVDLTRDQLSRAQTGALVARLVANNPNFASVFPYRDAEGRSVVVPIRGSDSLHDLSRLIRQSGGKGSFVAIAHDSEPGSVCLYVGNVIISERQDDGDHSVPVTPDCTVGDLLAVLATGATISYRLESSDMSLQELKTREVPIPA